MKQDSNIKKLSRRKLIKVIIAAVVSLEVVYVISGLIGKKRPKSLNSNLFNAGNVSSFENGKVYPFSSGLFYLSIFDDGGLLAISIKCTHLGCMVQSNLEKGYDCPCHASKFNKYGEVLSPPATRALDIFPITIEKGEVLVNTDQAIKRKRFEPSQLIYI